MQPTRWHWTRFSGLDAPALYRVVALREAVFVVEQNCAYLDCDGLDLQAWHLLGWRGATLVAYLRVLPPDLVYPDKQAIGRVVVAPQARGTGLGADLMREGIRRAEALGPEPIKISAQAYLEDWYGRLGFVTSGAGYLEDGIPHLPMIRARG
ncbi:MAG: ElaA protein [Bradymonadia bacterium]|jgi:ElaA protein